MPCPAIKMRKNFTADCAEKGSKEQKKVNVWPSWETCTNQSVSDNSQRNLCWKSTTFFPSLDSLEYLIVKLSMTNFSSHALMLRYAYMRFLIWKNLILDKDPKVVLASACFLQFHWQMWTSNQVPEGSKINFLIQWLFMHSSSQSWPRPLRLLETIQKRSPFFVLKDSCAIVSLGTWWLLRLLLSAKSWFFAPRAHLGLISLWWHIECRGGHIVHETLSMRWNSCAQGVCHCIIRTHAPSSWAVDGNHLIKLLVSKRHENIENGWCFLKSSYYHYFSIPIFCHLPLDYKGFMMAFATSSPPSPPCSNWPHFAVNWGSKKFAFKKIFSIWLTAATTLSSQPRPNFLHSAPKKLPTSIHLKTGGGGS